MADPVTIGDRPVSDMLGAPLIESVAVGNAEVLLVQRASSRPLREEPRLVEWLRTMQASGTVIREAPLDHGPLLERVLRAPPRLILMELGSDSASSTLALLRQLKADPTMAIVPVVLFGAGDAASALDAGADDVLGIAITGAEVRARLDAVMRRSERDLDVHPSTRLPGARAIEAELSRRLALGEPFAAGYADLDHFKEFNDRYGYHHGNQVILLLSRILHDAIKGRCGAAGFVGHIGGDDFLFVVPLDAMAAVCDAIIATFDELIPLQYSTQDRAVGYFEGKDRRGQVHRVPLMTLSIGVVTTQWRHFTRVSEVSDLATEMKTYAKGKPGSLWAVDRRRDEVRPESASAGDAS